MYEDNIWFSIVPGFVSGVVFRQDSFITVNPWWKTICLFGSQTTSSVSGNPEFLFSKYRCKNNQSDFCKISSGLSLTSSGWFFVSSGSLIATAGRRSVRIFSKDDVILKDAWSFLLIFLWNSWGYGADCGFCFGSVRRIQKQWSLKTGLREWCGSRSCRETGICHKGPAEHLLMPSGKILVQQPPRKWI